MTSSRNAITNDPEVRPSGSGYFRVQCGVNIRWRIMLLSSLERGCASSPLASMSHWWLQLWTSRLFIRKKRLIRTTDEKFHKEFKAKVCKGNRTTLTDPRTRDIQNVVLPLEIVSSHYTRHWRHQLTPARHVKLIHLLEDQPSLEHIVFVNHFGSSSLQIL